MFSLDGKTALVTGGARGLGAADARALAAAGAALAVVDLDGDGAAATAAACRRAGGRATGFSADITDAAAIEGALGRIESELGGPVDILVNNAAMLDNVAQLGDMREELWERDLRVNLTGTFRVTRAVFPGMCERGWGRIISMSSVAGTLGGFGQASYAATKAGIIGFTRTLALEGARRGVTANAIVPGVIATEAYLTIPEPMRRRLEARTAFHRPGEPQDIAATVVFLASVEAGYITGQAIGVTGGIDLFTF